MMSYNLSKLFEEAFGTKMPAYDFEKLENKGFRYPEGFLASFNPEILPNGKYGSSPYYQQDAIGRYYFMPVKLGEFELPYPLIRIQGRKRIVETPLTDRDGSVLEQISRDNYRIQIRGLIVDHDRRYPEDLIHQLKELFEQNKSLPIRSVLTDIFLVKNDHVVIEELILPEIKGVEHVKPYELSLIEDAVFDLELT